MLLKIKLSIEKHFHVISFFYLLTKILLILLQRLYVCEYCDYSLFFLRVILRVLKERAAKNVSEPVRNKIF